MITFTEIRDNEEIKAYIEQGDRVLGSIGYTEHSYAHATRVSKTASKLLHDLGYTDQQCELAAIAGYMHDIGNSVNRLNHAENGAILAATILREYDIDPKSRACIISAIGNHDESSSGVPDAVCAALILADKSDIRKSRVRHQNQTPFDIHDRVNYSVGNADLVLDREAKTVSLVLGIDDTSSPAEYFEIFLARMLLCKRAAEKLGLVFHLRINDQILL